MRYLPSDETRTLREIQDSLAVILKTVESLPAFVGKAGVYQGLSKLRMQVAEKTTIRASKGSDALK